MAGNNKDPFGSYNEKNVGRTVQNVTSQMWEPISTGAPVKKDTPVRKSPSAPPQQNQGQTKKTSGHPTKKQSKKQPSNDVTKDRISDGGPKAQKKPSAPPTKKKKNTAPNKKTAVGKNRTPKGRDTRNPDKQKSQAQQREKQRAKNLNKSRLEYDQQLKSGKSHDDIRKRTSNKKRKKSKVTVIVTVTVMLLFVAGLVCAYAYTKGAPISVITIEGESRYKNEKIIQTANLYSGLNMLSVREKAVNDTVTKALPYIKSVEVDYQLPDTILLTVTPTEEKLIIANGTGCVCVNEDDKVLSLKKKKLTRGRYLIEGLEAQEAVAGEIFVPVENNLEKYNKAKEIVAVLESAEGYDSGIVDVSNLADIRVTYQSRIRIYLGNGEKLENQLGLAMQVIKEGASEGQTGYIDMRFGDKAYLALGSMDIK